MLYSLTKSKSMSGYVATFLFVLLSMSIAGCSSTKTVPESVISQAGRTLTNSDTLYQDTMEATAPVQKDRIDIPLEPNVTKMSSEADAIVPAEPNIPLLSWADFYASIRPGVPVELAESLELESTDNEEKNLYEGFRIQIYSGPSPAMADTVSKQFRTWAVQHVSGYSPETYTFFKAPYYRVHVGDFHDRTRAYSVSQIVKRQFPDAWVVYDRVIPWNVPADSVLIRFQRY